MTDQDENVTTHRLGTTVTWGPRQVLWGTLMGIVVVPLWALVLLWLLSLQPADSDSARYSTAIVLLAEMGMLVPVWYFAVRSGHATWRQVGFRPFRPLRALGIGCLCAVFSMGFNVVWSLILAPFGLDAQPSLAPLLDQSVMGLIPLLLIGGIAAPLAEEAFFRGFMYAGLRTRFTVRSSLVISAGLFAMAHIIPTSMPPIFVLGVLFVILYELTGSIWPGILFHAATNITSILLTYLVAPRG